MTQTLVAEHPLPTDHAPLLERAFERPREDSYAIERIEGSIPEFVRGTYLMNGPALFARGERRYRHWLDGDGMVCALRFGEAGARITHRFVRSEKFIAEEAAGELLFRAFGTSFHGDRLVGGAGLASPVNVSVHPFAGRLLAFGEQGLPFELDAETLETRGEHNFGRLNRLSPFAAHPNFDPATGEMFNFGISFAPRRPCLHFYRFAANGELVFRRRLALEHPLSVHDFGLGPKHAVFYLSPYLMDMSVLTRPGGTLMDALRWEPGLGSRLLIVNRETGRSTRSVFIGSSYCLHLIGVFESGGTLSVDLLELDRPVYDQYRIPELFLDARAARPVRYRIDPEGGRLLEKVELPFRRMCDFPAIDPRRQGADYRDFWMLAISASEHRGRKTFDQLVHADWRDGSTSVYQAPAGCYLGGEPVFVPDPERRRGGAVICQRFDAETREGAFLVFDALDVAAGPIATLGLRHPIHLGFHATWDPRS